METALISNFALTRLCVVSLPMRDGNEWNEHIQRSGQKVVSLPMRDGNRRWRGAPAGG